MSGPEILPAAFTLLRLRRLAHDPAPLAGRPVELPA
jgi:hypothetical protein